VSTPSVGPSSITATWAPPIRRESEFEFWRTPEQGCGRAVIACLHKRMSGKTAAWATSSPQCLRALEKGGTFAWVLKKEFELPKRLAYTYMKVSISKGLDCPQLRARDHPHVP
jgi:hypothetical protein